MEKGLKSPDYEVATELCIDENTIMEEELKLIETVMPDLIKKTLNDDEISGGE